MEVACPNCLTPIAKQWHKVRCGSCERAKRADQAKVKAGEMDAGEYYDKWKPGSRRAHPVRALLEGAVPISGMVFFFNGEPYIAATKRDAAIAALTRPDVV